MDKKGDLRRRALIVKCNSCLGRYCKKSFHVLRPQGAVYATDGQLSQPVGSTRKRYVGKQVTRRGFG